MQKYFKSIKHVGAIMFVITFIAFMLMAFVNNRNNTKNSNVSTDFVKISTIQAKDLNKYNAEPLFDGSVNAAMKLAKNNNILDQSLRIAATDKINTDTLGNNFVDYIKPNATYQYSETDVDNDGKTFTMVFDMTDKFYTSGTLTLDDLTILIDGEEPNWTEVSKSLQEEDRTNIVNGESKVIGKRYTLTLSNLEQIQVKEGDNYLDYSGVITVAIPADKIVDETGNANNAVTLTSGISLPGGTGTAEVVDVVQPLVEKISSSVDANAKTATVIFKATDKYFANSTLTNTNIQVFVNGTENTTITKQLASTPLNEQRQVDGVTSTVQYGLQYTVTLTGIDTTVNQIKVRVPAGLITDQSGNGNEETDLILFNTLISARGESMDTSKFLGNSNIQREDIDQIVFEDSVPEDVYDEVTNTYINSTAWDVSAMQDDTIIAWYETNGNATHRVHIGSNHQIFGNTDSSYLFAHIGSGENCTESETIQNIELLNVGNVTDMSSMFRSTGSRAMTSLDLGDNFDTSNVTDMNTMFYSTGSSEMAYFNLGRKFDTSKVTNMRRMFSTMGSSSLTSLDLGENFDTSNVTDMNQMFTYTEMVRLDLGNKFNTSNVTDMGLMFAYAGRTALTGLDLENNFDTSSVTNMQGMFMRTGEDVMTSLDLGDKFDTSNVTDMSAMFTRTGYTAMTSLDLGDKFDTSNVTNMQGMFSETGCTAMTSLDLGDKFTTANVENMYCMFYKTGHTAMTNLDLGPAFTFIPDGTVEQINQIAYAEMFQNTGKQGEIIIQASEAIYQDATHFKLNTDSTTTIGWTDTDGNILTNYGTINPKYRTEWQKENVQTDTTTDANNPKLNVTLRGTTNPEVAADEYISDVTSSLTVDDIKVFIDDTEVTDLVTTTVGGATQTNNTRTGAKDILQVITITNFEEASRQAGKMYKEWSGNFRIEIAQGTLSDTTGPADAEGNRTTYGNKNMGLTDDGSREDNKIEDETKVDKNTEGAMFVDFIEPEFTYEYASTDINYDKKTLTVEFSVTDKYFNSVTINQNNITVKMIEEDVVPENIQKVLTKVDDITETRNGSEVKIGETYRLVISGFEQASKDSTEDYKDYSGPVSIAFPASILTDKSGNTNAQKTITVGINEPDQTGDAEVVDVVDPIWEVKNVQIDANNDKVTVDLIGTDKYYANTTLDVSKIKVIIDGEEITSTTNVTKQLSSATTLTENRNGATETYGVKYTLILSNWKETDATFEASGRQYREYSGNTQIQIEAGTLVDESGNENEQTTLDLGMIDIIKPEIRKVSSTKNDANKTETIVFDVIDKYFDSAEISTTDTSRIHVFVDNEEAIGVTKTITNTEDLTATVNGSSKVIGKRYTLVISDFEQERTTPVNYDREYSDWSGNVFILIDPATVRDESGNTN